MTAAVVMASGAVALLSADAALPAAAGRVTRAPETPAAVAAPPTGGSPLSRTHGLFTDPLLPAALIPSDWPADTLRDAYRRFDDSFKQHMDHAFRQSAR